MKDKFTDSKNNPQPGHKAGYKVLVFFLIKLKLWFHFKVLFPLKLKLLEANFHIKNFSLNKLMSQLKSKSFWKDILKFIYLQIEKLEDSLKKLFSKHPKFVPAILCFLLLGSSPLIWKFSRQAQSYLTKSNTSKAHASIKQAKKLSQKKEDTKALEKYTSAVTLQPKSYKTNYEIALFFIQKQDFPEAEKYIKALSKLYPQKPGTIGLCGAFALNKGDYQLAKSKLKEAYKKGLTQNWLIDAYAVSLLANKKTKQASSVAFKLAGWPKDCEANYVSHAYCMKHIASWHRKISSIEDRLKRCPVDSTILHHHRQREIIYLGESLRAFLQGIQENEGLYRDFLVKEYWYTKQLLKNKHATILRNKYLDKTKTAYSQLSSYEKSLKI